MLLFYLWLAWWAVVVGKLWTKWCCVCFTAWGPSGAGVVGGRCCGICLVFCFVFFPSISSLCRYLMCRCFYLSMAVTVDLLCLSFFPVLCVPLFHFSLFLSVSFSLAASLPLCISVLICERNVPRALQPGVPPCTLRNIRIHVVIVYRVVIAAMCCVVLCCVPPLLIIPSYNNPINPTYHYHIFATI